MEKDYKLPKYSHEEEVVNSITHLVGLFFAISITFYFIISQVKRNIPFSEMYPYYIYTFFMMVVFCISAFYHSRPMDTKERHISRVIDHSDIYLFVAATYTPICILAITATWISTTLMIIEWGLAILGATLNIINMSKNLNNKVINIFTYSIYLIAGWALVIFYPAISNMEFIVFLFILLGGITYTTGAIFYAIGRKKKWMHSIFHIFVLVADVLQFIGIYFILN